MDYRIRSFEKGVFDHLGEFLLLQGREIRQSECVRTLKPQVRF